MISVGNMIANSGLLGKFHVLFFVKRGRKFFEELSSQKQSQSICGTKASCKVYEESGNYTAALLLYCGSPQAKKKKTARIICLQGDTGKALCMHSILFREPVTEFQVSGRNITNTLERSKKFFYSSLDLWY